MIRLSALALLLAVALFLIGAPAWSRTGVVVNETQVYEEPDLDAPVIAVVQPGVKLPISKGTRGEFAKFYRTRVSGKLGWIVTLDIKSEAEAKKVLKKARGEATQPGPFINDERDEKYERGEKPNPNDPRDREPFVFSRNVSFILGWLNGYKESINGQDYVADMVTYGLKLTGPDVLLTGPLMDVNLMFHYGAPDYYKSLSTSAPSGFVMWADANLLLPIRFRQDSLIGIGAGPLLVISNIEATQSAQQTYTMRQVNLGLNIELTGGMRFGKFSVRLDGRYMFEKKTYRQIQIAVGTVF